MKTTSLRTGSLAWGVAGDSGHPGLVLIHSLGADSRMWADQIPELEKHRRVIWIDLPGHGSSDAEKGDYTIESLGLDIADVAGEAGFETFDVCGISLGGVISLWLAIDLQERVDRLIACNTGAKIGTAEAWSERIETVLEGGMEAIRDAVVPRFITTDLEQRRPDAYGKVYEMFDAIDPVGYAGCCAALRDMDLRDSVAEISAPTLLVGGSEDIATPPDTMESLHGSISGSRLRIIEGAAHLSNIDQPQRFNETVIEEIT